MVKRVTYRERTDRAPPPTAVLLPLASDTTVLYAAGVPPLPVVDAPACGPHEHANVLPCGPRLPCSCVLMGLPPTDTFWPASLESSERRVTRFTPVPSSFTVRYRN